VSARVKDIVLVCLLGAGVVWTTGCQTQQKGVQSTLEGQITVEPSVDTTGDYSGFRVLVADAEGWTIDTLAHAVTDRSGTFSTSVRAPERGVFPLSLWGRDGKKQVGATDLVIAEGDSATLEASLPQDANRLRVQSRENDAWAGYQSAMGHHHQTLLRRVEGDVSDVNATSQGVRQTSSILWSLRKTFPGTYAAQMAAVESVTLLEGWNDSLIVERIHEISPENPRYVEAARVARRAMERTEGRQSALALLDTLEARARTDNQRAGVHAVRVGAFIDSLQSEAALSAAGTLRNRYPNTKWSRWAKRVRYELNDLQPGRVAPNVTVHTLLGDSLTIGGLRGRPVVLEFYRPEHGLYARQLHTRNALYRATRPDSVAFVSISVEPDTLVNEAFLRTRSVPGHRVIAVDGLASPVAKSYNVVHTPVRFLISAEGRIVRRYAGSALLALQNDLLAKIEAMPDALEAF